MFRHGTIFDIFENEKVNANTLLEGMFGQTAGIRSTSLSSSTTSIISKKTPKTNISEQNPTSVDKKIIKVVDFDKQKKSNENNSNKKIKIKTF